jgi:hypothetical protein
MFKKTSTLSLALLLPFFASACAAGATGTTPSSGDDSDGRTIPSDTSDEGASANGGGGSGSGSANGGESGGSGSGSADDADSTGPIVIKNLSFAKGDGSGLEITFALANKGAASIYKIQEVTIDADGSKATYAANCTMYEWELGPGETSGVLTLDLTSSGSYSSLTLGVGCSYLTGEPLDLAAVSSLRVDITGLFDDAAQWKAHATATR